MKLMKATYLNSLIRLFIVLVFILLINYLLSPIINSYNRSFEIIESSVVTFILYVLIGASFPLIHTNIFNKSNWTTNIDPVKIIFTVIIFFLAIPHFVIYTVGLPDFLVSIYVGNFSSPHPINALQMLFGYSVISMFLRHADTN